jgi:hypothetical protein
MTSVVAHSLTHIVYHNSKNIGKTLSKKKQCSQTHRLGMEWWIGLLTSLSFSRLSLAQPDSSFHPPHNQTPGKTAFVQSWQYIRVRRVGLLFPKDIHHHPHAAQMTLFTGHHCDESRGAASLSWCTIDRLTTCDGYWASSLLEMCTVPGWKTSESKLQDQQVIKSSFLHSWQESTQPLIQLDHWGGPQRTSLSTEVVLPPLTNFFHVP